MGGRGERRQTAKSLTLQREELPVIQKDFAFLFDKPGTSGSVAKELRTALVQSNLSE